MDSPLKQLTTPGAENSNVDITVHHRTFSVHGVTSGDLGKKWYQVVECSSISANAIELLE